jgi:alpha-glucosidase
MQTLRQLAESKRGKVTLRGCEITDWPAFRIRGFMQDVGRTYIPMEELKREIAVLSRFKVNVFHWHLTENQAWRLESKLFPMLNDSHNMTRCHGQYYTLEEAKELVDFAVKRNLQYIHFDAGWYGYEYIKESDATTVTVDPRRNPKGDLDLKEAVAYAKKHGIGVFVYVNQRALYAQLDEMLPLYKSWGIDGIKFGFVQVGSHRWTTWMHEAVMKCAKYGLLVDIHDEYRPTGFSRTYPNLLTQEGIMGNEEMPTATQNTIQPFTRYIAGAADYTVCYYVQKSILEAAGKKNPRCIQTTSAHQMALSVICYSPLQFLYWYDKPSDSQDEPELEFFDNVPTVWDDTKVLGGKPGEFVSMARRSGNKWFVGIITNDEEREVRLAFDFLEPGKEYWAHLYYDDPKVKTRTKVGIKKIKLTNQSVMDIKLKATGGEAIMIEEI